VSGALQFGGGNAGTLKLLLEPGYDVSYLDSFTIINAGSISGVFGALAGDGPGHGLSWQVDYTGTTVTVTAVPAPGAAGLLIAGLIAAGRRRR
jgi:MYXO-CTERM domain-containing protein